MIKKCTSDFTPLPLAYGLYACQKVEIVDDPYQTFIKKLMKYQG